MATEKKKEKKALILAPKYSASFKPLQTFSDCILSCAVRLPGVIVLEHVAFIVLEPLPINPTFTAPLYCCYNRLQKNSKSRPRSAFRALLLALNWGPDCGPKKRNLCCVRQYGRLQKRGRNMHLKTEPWKLTTSRAMLDKLRPPKLRNQLPAAHQAPAGKRRCFQSCKTCKKNFLHVSNMTKNLFFVASAFRPVWPGRCDLSFICTPQSARALD